MALLPDLNYLNAVIVGLYFNEYNLFIVGV